jgi:hypothetical protein
MKEKKQIAFAAIENSPLENIVVEKGKKYKDMVLMVKEMHQQAINNDATSLSDYTDWLFCQYFLLQKAVFQISEELQ